MSPVVRVRLGSDGTIAVPVSDDDDNIVRCRWANLSLDECAGVSNGFPEAVLDGFLEAVLDEQACTIPYTVNGTAGYYAVALHIEDFLFPTDTVPLSSVPLEFLILVSQPMSNCTNKSTIVNPVMHNNDCVDILVNSIYNESIVARSDCGPNLSIIDINLQSPSGLTKSPFLAGPGLNEWHIEVFWTPTPSQIEKHVLCFTASDSEFTSSDQISIFLVVTSNF